MTQVQVLQPGQQRTRFHRRPNFPIAGTMRPMELYPIMCHPVLPGETLKSSTTRWSVVSMPLVNPLCGAWLEAWLFYVKLTDIDRDLGEMFISDTLSTTPYLAAATDARYFTLINQIDWVRLCLDRIVEAYFINEGEAVQTGLDAMPRVKLNIRSWYQNLMFEPAEVALDTSGPRDAHEQMRAWEMLQQMQMTEITYERYLEQYGVTSIRESIGNPEILRYSRSWAKPVNHVEPSTGVPSSAWVWNDEMKTEKDKRFTEPGFILQVAAIRPKFYQRNVLYSMIGNLWGFTDWYPAYNLPDPSAGVRNIGTTDPVFHTDWNAAEADAPLLYDHRDLLSHGEQFINDRSDNKWAWPLATGMSGIAAAAPADVRGEYPENADIDALFSVQTASEDKRCQYEGITSMVIAGHVTDTTR